MKHLIKKDFLPFLFVLIFLFPFIFISKQNSLLYVNGLHTSFYDEFFKQVTWLGEGFMISCCLLVLLFVRVRWFFTFLIALVLHLLFINVNKHFFFDDVLRPMGYFSSINKEHFLHVAEGVRLHSHHSFPSGHTTGATFAAFFIALVFNNRWMTISMAVLGLLVGISRVYLAQHFVVDIFFGYFFGSLSSLTAIYVINKIEANYPWMQNFLIKNKVFRIPQVFGKEVAASNQ